LERKHEIPVFQTVAQIKITRSIREKINKKVATTRQTQHFKFELLFLRPSNITMCGKGWTTALNVNTAQNAAIK
jgi:hypothetical protein